MVATAFLHRTLSICFASSCRSYVLTDPFLSCSFPVTVIRKLLLSLNLLCLPAAVLHDLKQSSYGVTNSRCLSADGIDICGHAWIHTLIVLTILQTKWCTPRPDSNMHSEPSGTLLLICVRKGCRPRTLNDIYAANILSASRPSMPPWQMLPCGRKEAMVLTTKNMTQRKRRKD